MSATKRFEPCFHEVAGCLRRMRWLKRGGANRAGQSAPGGLGHALVGSAGDVHQGSVQEGLASREREREYLVIVSTVPLIIIVFQRISVSIDYS